jgi:hypothetical protein
MFAHHRECSLSMPGGFENLWGSAAAAALVLFIIYRRFRRTFGRQALRPRRMIVRMVLLSVIAVVLAPAAVRSSANAWALAAALLLGVALAVWGARHTRFESHAGELHYVPHTYAGMVVSALFLGRLLYRLLALPYSAVSSGAAATAAGSPALETLYQSPLTLAVFFILIGYYLSYYGYVLYKSQQLRRAQGGPPTPVID